MANQSGTRTFSLLQGEVTLEVYERLGWRAASITPEMAASALRSCNLIQSRWTNLGVNLYSIQFVSLPLIAGTATYTLTPPVIDILPEAVIETTVGGQTTDRVIFPLSREEYTSIANKTQQGPPTSFWFNRLTTPQITFWPPPDNTASYLFNYWQFVPQQDAIYGNFSPDVPYRFLEAYNAAVAAHLAMKWKPDRFLILSQYADRVWTEASDADREKVPMRIVPDTSGYMI